MASGNLSKLVIFVYKDNRFDGPEEYSISVPVNPNKFSRSLKIEYNTEQEQGKQSDSANFSRTPPEEIQFEFLFDGTGVIPGSDRVQDRIKELKDAVYMMNGDIHRPNYLKLIWGDLSFCCQLKDLKIDYNLFKADGTPIRAIVNASFMEVTEDELASSKMATNSPDLTHVRYVKEGDTLPLMTYRIYGDAGLYIQVAKYNGFTDFRNLKPNTQVVFPPIDKTAS